MPTTTITTEPAVEANKARLNTRVWSAKELAEDVSVALTAGSKAYFSGIVELGRTLGGFGGEVIADVSQHVRAILRAKNLRAVGELQAAFAQRQIEVSANHVKEFADLARTKSEEAIAPIATLLKHDSTT